MTAETCNTYNMLKLTEHLFELGAVGRDAWISTSGRSTTRSSPRRIRAPACSPISFPTKPGLFKTYSTPDNSFWCCVGTGMENHAKYGEMIYAHSGDAFT